MGKAGGIIGIIAGVFGIIAAVVTLFVGGIGAAFEAEGATTVVGLGWGAFYSPSSSLSSARSQSQNPRARV